LDYDRIADDYLRLAGQARVRPPWTQPDDQPMPEARAVRHRDGTVTIVDEVYYWHRAHWDQLVEVAGRAAGKTARLREELDAWAAEYERVHGVPPEVASVRAGKAADRDRRPAGLGPDLWDLVDGDPVQYFRRTYLDWWVYARLSSGVNAPPRSFFTITSV
jgi:hypothetical protein